MRLPKTPSYEEMGKQKPKPKGRNIKYPRPFRDIVCAHCKQTGGTLVLVEGSYYHQEHKPEEPNASN